ncbi:hypothetical protein [Alkalinema sp. FACHB-956]|uniref:hypothetical protein n=1 Tax=Alkalinema sp. FACHB-956 TaxID=2692768 RepID=UPI001F550FFE|nr:hypothetical protein [Alkalinema sp. FACHB-956]
MAQPSGLLALFTPNAPPMEPSTDFLTVEECALVDAALLTSRDKFTTRVAIYALRSLKQIANTKTCTIAELSPQDIAHWIAADPSLQSNVDSNFKTFFTQLVLSSLKPLNQAAESIPVSLENLSIEQLIHWFEQQAKQKLESN